jgi:hypothetical protein
VANETPEADMAEVPLAVPGGLRPSRSRLGRPVATEEVMDAGGCGASDFCVGVEDALSIVTIPTNCPPSGTIPSSGSFDLRSHR